MNILLATPITRPDGATDPYLLALARGLERQEREVVVLISDDPAMDGVVSRLPTSCMVMRHPMKSIADYRSGAFGAVRDRRSIDEVRRLLEDVGPDLVHVCQPTGEDGLGLILAAQRADIPCVSTIQSGVAPNRSSGRWRWLRRGSARRTMGKSGVPLISVSEHEANQLKSWLPPAAIERLSVVHNGVPEPAPTMGARVRIREQLCFAPDVPVLGMAGELNPEHGPLFILDVLHLMEQRDCVPSLVWIGDGPMRERFEQRAAELGMDHRVRVTGWVDSTADYLAAVDCFCLPSHRFGLPMTLLEAMRMGICCIGNDIDGIGEALHTDISGILLPEGDLMGWANTLETVLDDRKFRITLGEGALRAARSRFNLGRMTSETVQVYESLLLQDALEFTP